VPAPPGHKLSDVNRQARTGAVGRSAPQPRRQRPAGALSPLPTPRSGHGLVILDDRFYAMGGEEGVWTNGQLAGRVFGQMESYDPKTDTWQSHAPMLTPRHGLGAVLLGRAGASAASERRVLVKVEELR
jgi:hypothetical protein